MIACELSHSHWQSIRLLVKILIGDSGSMYLGFIMQPWPYSALAVELLSKVIARLLCPFCFIVAHVKYVVSFFTFSVFFFFLLQKSPGQIYYITLCYIILVIYTPLYNMWYYPHCIVHITLFTFVYNIINFCSLYSDECKNFRVNSVVFHCRYRFWSSLL